jgi:hypothetical protein
LTPATAVSLSTDGSDQTKTAGQGAAQPGPAAAQASEARFSEGCRIGRNVDSPNSEPQ